ALLVAVVLWRSAGVEQAERARVPGSDAGLVALNGANVDPVLTALLTRIYGAFGQVEEGKIYDGIASAVVPELAAELYLQRRAVQMAEATEDGVAEIMELDIQEVAAVPGQASAFDVTWAVLGRLGHEDHEHERYNIYSARLTLAPVSGEWRLAEFDLDQVQRKLAPLFFNDF
ncbi:MAG: hypothetical protein AAGA78_05285, partial [Pseudomonadota bacterium]